MDILQKIQRSLAERRMSQAEAERLAGLPTNRITKWKDDRGKVTAAQALRLARVLGKPVEWLIDDEMIDVPPPLITRDEAIVLRIVRQMGVDYAVDKLTRPDGGTTGNVTIVGPPPAQPPKAKPTKPKSSSAG